MNGNGINLKVKQLMGNSSKKILIKILFPFRNNFCLFNVFNRAKNHEVNLNYWNESKNLGDSISPVIVRYLLEKKGINIDKKVKQRKHLYAVGSVLTAGIQDCTVWGSGILNAKLTYRLLNRKMDIRAVRGPLTRCILCDYGFNCPTVYGDPAIFLPEIYNPKEREKKYKYGIVLHKDYIFSEIKDNESIYINIKSDDYKEFVNKLCSVEMVISSSLHGIILAEAYGIPAILLKPQVDILKYYDYYFGTERYEFPIAKTVKEAKKMTPVNLPNFSMMKENLLNAFPYDLYSE